MVDEFSSFARMPAPIMKVEDLREICRQAVFLQRNAHSEIRFESDLPSEPVSFACDARQLHQALVNLLKNAAELIEARSGQNLPQGEIRVALMERGGGSAALVVEDNGRGFPRELMDRLTEPYVTTRTKGTGLGLAIVKKIMEDHGGDLVLEDRPEGGARAELVLPGERRAAGASDEKQRATA